MVTKKTTNLTAFINWSKILKIVDGHSFLFYCWLRAQFLESHSFSTNNISISTGKRTLKESIFLKIHLKNVDILHYQHVSPNDCILMGKNALTYHIHWVASWDTYPHREERWPDFYAFVQGHHKLLSDSWWHLEH